MLCYECKAHRINELPGSFQVVELECDLLDVGKIQTTIAA
jgi:hypothetical protein